MIIKHQTGLKRLKLRDLKKTLRVAFLSFKQSVATQKYLWGRTQPTPSAYLKKPHIHQSRRAHFFCDPPRSMAISVQGTNEWGGFCKQEACGAPYVCATCRGCVGADLCCPKNLSTGSTSWKNHSRVMIREQKSASWYNFIGGSRLLLLSE